jgi:hypothetical protein
LAGVAGRDDCKSWEQSLPEIRPILADPLAAAIEAVPFEGEIPYRCAVTPRMELIACYSAEPEGDDPAVRAIRDHWEANRP